MNWKATLFSTLALGAFTAFAGEVKTESWATEQNWKAENQAIAGENGAQFLFLKDKKNYKAVEFSANVTPIKADGENWKVCGIGLYQADDMFWYLGFVETPDNMANKQHVFELKAMKGDVWGAEAKLKNIVSKVSGTWEYNKTYKFNVKLSQGKIEGTIADASGKVIANFAYELPAGEFSEGTPVLRVVEMQAKFDNFNIQE